MDIQCTIRTYTPDNYYDNYLIVTSQENYMIELQYKDEKIRVDTRDLIAACNRCQTDLWGR